MYTVTNSPFVTNQDEVERLKCEQAWLLVADQEKHVAEMDQQLNEMGVNCGEMRRTFNSKATMEAKVKEYMEKFAAERDALRLAMRSDQDAYERMRTAFAQKQKLHDDLRRTVQKEESRQKRLEKDIAQLEKEISERTES